jgi:CBS domain-containing protein
MQPKREEEAEKIEQAYLDKRVGDVAEKEMVVLAESTTVADAVRVMKEKDVSSVLVGSGSGRRDNTPPLPAGIVTERDILYRVVAENKGPFKVTLKEVMSSPLVTIDESASVRDAISVMRRKGIRRLPVTDSKGRMTGVVTLKAVVGNMPGKSVELATVEVGSTSTVASGVVCPYCGSSFDGKADLSKHIDRLHIGSGLLEGDVRQL